MDTNARFGFQSLVSQSCNGRICMGANMAIIHDVDGSSGVSSGPSQLLFGNPAYAAPYPQCTTVSELGLGLVSCSSSSVTAFRQYGALWRDSGKFVIEPIVITRSFTETAIPENRTYATYMALKDLCPMRFPVSMFPLLIASGQKQIVRTTGN
jgi:hypothetical protein